MREKKFTEGPWAVCLNDNGQTWIVDNNGIPPADAVCAISLCEEYKNMTTTEKADANLIAAAPELLETCEFLVEVINSMNHSIRTGETWDMKDVEERGAKADASIAKAYGE